MLQRGCNSEGVRARWVRLAFAIGRCGRADAGASCWAGGECGFVCSLAAGALHTPHIRRTQGTRQDRFFRPRLVAPPPAVVAIDVLNWSEVLQPTGSAQGVASHHAATFGSGGVPSRAHADRMRKQRCVKRMAEAVYSVD